MVICFTELEEEVSYKQTVEWDTMGMGIYNKHQRTLILVNLNSST